MEPIFFGIKILMQIFETTQLRKGLLKSSKRFSRGPALIFVAGKRCGRNAATRMSRVQGLLGSMG